MLSLTAMCVNTPCQLFRREISLTESKHNDKQRMPWRVVTGSVVIQYNALWLRAVSLICLRSARLRVRARSYPRTSALALEIYIYNRITQWSYGYLTRQMNLTVHDRLCRICTRCWGSLYVVFIICRLKATLPPVSHVEYQWILISSMFNGNFLLFVSLNCK